MFRILLVSIYLASLLICPLRCAKSLPMDQEPLQVGQHVHCCSSCLRVHAKDSTPDGSQNESVEWLEDSSASFPDSGCGCLTCVCKSSLFSSKETFSDDVQKHSVAIRSFLQCQVKRNSSFIPDSRESRCETRPYGRGMRQLLQSWLI